MWRERIHRVFTLQRPKVVSASVSSLHTARNVPSGSIRVRLTLGQTGSTQE